MSATETEPEGTPVEDETEAIGPALDDPWYLTWWGVGVFAIDALLALFVIVGTSGVAVSALEPLAFDVPEAVTVDGYVYVFALLGAIAYVFTAVVRDFDRTRGELLKYNVRVLAALPLAAGVFLLSAMTFEQSPSQPMLAGLAFVTGLYVNRVYERIGMLADRLIPRE